MNKAKLRFAPYSSFERVRTVGSKLGQGQREYGDRRLLIFTEIQTSRSQHSFRQGRYAKLRRLVPGLFADCNQQFEVKVLYTAVVHDV